MPDVARTLGRLVLAACLLPGCGAKTGLRAPDIDAGPDAARDAGHDAGPPPQCIEVPPDGSPLRADFSIPASLQIVDVMFVIDATGSMRDQIDNVRTRLRDVVAPGVRALIPDAAFGVAFLGEFPVMPHARPDSGVHPYELRSPITTDVEHVAASFESPPSWGNLDIPEADVEALFQVATGEGLPPFIEASFGCPMGGSGGVCFRDESFHVVMLVTDAPMHNGPNPANDYNQRHEFDPGPFPHGYRETLDALRAIDVTVVGLGVSHPTMSTGVPDLTQLARDLGSVDGSGRPLVFDIGSRGDQIGDSIVAALERLASDVPLDVVGSVEGIAGAPIDARMLVSAVRALSADPPSGIGSASGDRFLGVHPGTRLTFEIDIDASRLPPSTMRREVPGRVVFGTVGGSRVGSTDVVFVIPGADGHGC
jgi:hypothetical protein